jgi:hypothetical protein
MNWNEEAQLIEGYVLGLLPKGVDMWKVLVERNPAMRSLHIRLRHLPTNKEAGYAVSEHIMMSAPVPEWLPHVGEILEGMAYEIHEEWQRENRVKPGPKVPPFTPLIAEKLEAALFAPTLTDMFGITGPQAHDATDEPADETYAALGGYL